MSVDLTWVSYVALIVSAYYGFLFCLSLRRATVADRSAPARRPPFFVLVIPAHNESLVISETLNAATALDYDDYLVLVMNDGSADDTSALAKSFRGPTGRVEVIDRPASVAGRGKGDVLNDAFSLISALLDTEDAILGGRSAVEIIVGVIDGDGQLERHALTEIAALFDDPWVGGAQIGVRIANARDRFLTRMQDLEFTGFSWFVQQARDRFGSVGLGGNGQFTRMSALLALDSAPWTGCLTEDLDLGLRLVKAGWRVRFCAATSVAQQGVTAIRPLVRQRARWIHGHYQCWRHIPSLLRSDRQRIITRIDLCLYLILVVFVMLVFFNFVTGIAGAAGWIRIENEFLSFIPRGVAKNIFYELVAFGPVVTFMWTYQRRSAHPLRFWEIPAYGFGFALYSYLWIAATVWAWIRIALGRDAWAKTRRVAASPAFVSNHIAITGQDGGVAG